MSQAQRSATEYVSLKKQRYIPVSKDHFLSVLLDKFPSDEERELFAELASSIETLFYVNRISSVESFKECFSCFSRLDTFPHTLPLDELKARQLKLMKMIYGILRDAHFEPITFELYKNSIEKVFISDVPVKVDWAKLDSHLLTTFYNHYPSLNPYRNLKRRPPFYQHFAMFYRGYGLNKMDGLFITPKLNLILADLEPMLKSYFSQFIAFMTATLFSHSKRKNVTKEEEDAASESLIKKESENGNGSNNDVNSDNLSHIDMLTLKRRSILDTYKVAKAKGIRSTLYWFLKKIQIQEPTFKRLMLIYREIPETFLHEKMRKMKDKATRMKKRANRLKSRLKQKAKKQIVPTLEELGLNNPTDDGDDKELNAEKKEEEKADQLQAVVDEIGRRRTASLMKLPDVDPIHAAVANVEDCYLYPVRIHYFSDVPMSDLEITYPQKTFSLKPMDQVYLAFTVLIGVWAIFKELLFGADTTFGVFVIMMSVFLMIRSLVWYRSTEMEYVRVLGQALAESNVSSDKDTILSLIDSVDEQQFMETMLAYFVLLRNETEVITDGAGVDGLCEKLMEEEFGKDVNVQIEGAMTKLTELGLFKNLSDSIEMSKDDSIRVKNLEDSIASIRLHYQSAIQSVRKIQRHMVDAEVEEGSVGLETVSEEKVKIEITEVPKETTPEIISAKDVNDEHYQ